MHTISATVEPTESKDYFDVDLLPDECPVCKKGGQFKVIAATWKETNDITAEMQVVFKCPREKCATFFMALYENNFTRQSGTLHLSYSGVLIYEEPATFPEIINKISPKFSIIYNEAKIAEDIKLNEICGVGYGKSLEFLIKDYLIYLDSSKTEEIKKITKLGILIDRISDKNIQIVAKRAAWLRNDETHYERKWETKDVQNLKDLIELTLRHIQTAEMTKQYEKDMPEE